jgi:hypothetical protein
MQKKKEKHRTIVTLIKFRFQKIREHPACEIGLFTGFSLHGEKQLIFLKKGGGLLVLSC